MTMKHERFNVNDLNKIAGSEVFRLPGEKSIGFGEIVRLNSGGCDMLVTDITGDNVLTLEWISDTGFQECDIPEPCVHRVSSFPEGPPSHPISRRG
jgi:uncharacterized protein YodC (DUF2158 family)